MALTTTAAAGFIAGGGQEGNVAREANQEKGNYEVISGFCIGNAINVWPGDVISLTPDEARRWVGLDLVKLTDKPVGPAQKQAAQVRNQDPKAVTNRDPR